MIPSNPTLPFTPSGLDFDFGTSATWAQLYRLRGMQVVPAYRPGEPKHGMSWKRPFLKEWIEYQEALIPDVLFSSWYGPGGQFVSRENMGMITGRASDNLFVIDLDLYKTPAAAAWWNELMMIHNNNMDLTTLEQVTGGGGSQKIYRAPPGWTVPNKAIHNIGVDIKGQGGFVMLPPSMHESGRAYEWVDGQGPDDMPPTLAPDWLLEAVAALVAEYGGTTGPNGAARQPPPQGIYDGFGHLVDSREDKMRAVVWAAILDWNEECPIKPSRAESDAKAAEKYLEYEKTVESRIPGDPSTKAARLDAENPQRGPQAFQAKWDRAMRKWDTEVYTEARKPGRDRDKGWTNKDNKSPPEYVREPLIPPISGPLILTSAEFLAGFTPPAYLIDGIIQRGYLYSLTARTHHGKTAVALYMAQAIARGVYMHGCKVLPGTVLILAGENPDDVRARFFVLGKAYGFDPAASKIRWIPGVKHLPSHMPIIRQEVEKIDDLVLVLVDTAAAYFPGTETNSNSEQGEYARLLRELTFLKGKPAAIALSHPVKNAARDNLLPMGGSAFLNEVDGNLTLWAGNDRQTTLHWQGKFRGPEFDPMTFELAEESCDAVKDVEGRLLPSVVAKPMSGEAVAASEEIAEKDEDRLMRALYEKPKEPFEKLAIKLGWKKRRVQTLMDRLHADKLVVQKRNKKYALTDKGKEEIGALKGGKDD